MTVITIELEVPDWISDGLAAGTLERVGGVIRDAEGRRSTRAWLREAVGSGDQAVGDLVPPQASHMLEQLGMGVQALPVLQLANLAVSAAGFALVLHRLGELDRKIDTIAERMRSVGKDVRWTRDLLDRDLLARVRAATRKLALDAFADPTASRAVLGDLIDIAETLDGRRDLLLDSGTAYADAELFAVYSEHLATCIRLQLGLAWRIGPAEQAVALARDWAGRLGNAAGRLEAPIRAGLADPAAFRRFIALDDGRRSASGANRQALRELSADIEQQAMFIETCHAAGLAARDLEALDIAHSGSLMLIGVDGSEAGTQP